MSPTMSLYLFLAAMFYSCAAGTIVAAHVGIIFAFAWFGFIRPAGNLWHGRPGDAQGIAYVSNEVARNNIAVLGGVMEGSMVSERGVPLGPDNIALIFHDMMFPKPGRPAIHSDPSSIYRICFNGNSLGDGGLLLALKFASKFPGLHILELPNNGIKLAFGQEEMERVLTYVRESSITSLNLSGNDFSSTVSLQKFSLLLSELANKHSMHELAFSGCNLGTEHCRALASFILSPAAHQLELLFLNANDFSLGDHAILFRAAKQNFSILSFSSWDEEEVYKVENYEDLLKHEVPADLKRSLRFGDELSIYFDAICYRNELLRQAQEADSEVTDDEWETDGEREESVG
ncbi:uncharacterized protein LOC62_04G006103 [Vanrija pseudolonga]|uniref:Uncharacterized protein n=1 Tax=Vanrija pseudolonga TaxID=143232 RepID=A0AAF0Y9F6_9TREE|nr:hypothetical protein LOC62_04G006103 [Vanrija pseudolonga]